MKKCISILLTITLVVSLAGCYVNTTGMKDAASEAADELVDDAVDYVEEEIDNAITDFKMDLINKFNDEVNTLKKKINQTKNNIMKVYTIHYIATDATNVPAVQSISRIALFSKISNQIPVKEGYRFLGWGTSTDSEEVVYSPGQEWNAKKSEVLYAIWEECTHKKSENNLYGLNLDTDGEAHCQECHGILPPGLYYFSDYLKATLPKWKFWKKDYTDLNQEELGKALEGYIKCKGHSYNEVFGYIDEVYSKDNVILQGFDDVHEGIKLIDGYFQLIYQDGDMYDAMVNKDDFWTFYQIKNITTSVDTFRTIMSAAGTFHSIISFGKTCEELSQEELKGITNTYHIDMQKIESGIQFAQVAGNVVGFLHSLAGGQTVPGLTPEPEDYKEKIKDLKYRTVSIRIWESLHDSLYVEDIEACTLAFKSNGEEDIQVQKERWPSGPTAEQTIYYIEQLVNLPGEEHPALQSWYFYLGWRVEYECVNVIQMILDDKI